ncbi:MAG: M13 family metallopeptidase [Patescibacteria group bacterium]|nr:M13 family metallopeptidase [Patescibacteria group bacterium]MDE2015457.1 M13 family metallopeptidase [Patescibacteria group bacterium]MDE2226927.1 M13 family metallopeptidase [Patescibacteria group bacterium]
MPLSSAIDKNNFDKSVKPTDDFFRYVNGGWMKNNPIPPDEASWGSFDVLRFNVEQQLKNIFEEVVAKKDLVAGSAEQKIRDFYLSATDVESRNRAGASPLTELFQGIDGIKKREDIVGAIGFLHRRGINAFWIPFIDQDERDSEMMALHFWQGGLGLPDRDYYLNNDENSLKIRTDYLSYMKDILALANMASSGEDICSVIMNMETLLAKASSTPVELRDVEKNYNKVTLEEFSQLAPKIPLSSYFPSINNPKAEYLLLGQPKFLLEINSILAETPLEDLKLYLRWRVLNGTDSYLGEDMERRHFEFYGRTFAGQTEMKPLWRRALNATSSALDELVGQLYVERHFNEDAKKKIKDLVGHLASAYAVRIEKLDWMSEKTKKKALEKLQAVSKKLGYPDVWKDYSALSINADSFAGNVIRADVFEFDRKIKEVGGPVNRNEWFMPPQMVNAYYQASLNDIVFPAAILQPPFFDPNADDAVNFGGIGSVIGHELTHGFDDQGSRFDNRGNLNEWWTKEDKDKFEAEAAKLAGQFDEYEPIPGMHVNGKLTLGENIADLGGLLIAYDALKLKLAETPVEENIDGFSPEQRFFIGYAITEQRNVRDELTRLHLQTNPHSPSEFRVNGPMSNMQEFYDAFDCNPGDKLWRDPEERVKIW